MGFGAFKRIIPEISIIIAANAKGGHVTKLIIDSPLIVLTLVRSAK